MQIATAFQRYSDVGQQANQLSSFGRSCDQLDCGPYSGGFLACRGDGVGFFAERAMRRLGMAGAGPDGVVSAVVLLSSPGHVINNGLPFTVNDVLLVAPGGAYDAVADAGVEPAVFSVSLESVAAPSLRRLSTQQEGRTRRVTSPALAGQFRDVAGDILRSWNGASEGVTMPQAAMHELMFELLTSPSAPNGSSHASVRLYRAARDVMLDALGEPLTMPELASRVGTSRRNLERAFDRCASVSPARFHKLLRLNNARRLLEGGQHSVSRAAASSGLRHLGRFSGDYHGLFGELPSETAQRARVLFSEPA